MPSGPDREGRTVFDRFLGSDDDQDGEPDSASATDDTPPEATTDGTPESDADQRAATTPGPRTLLGETYDITEQGTDKVGTRRVITETESEGTVAGPYVREMLEAGVNRDPAPLWIGYDEDPQTGFREAPLRFESLFRHIWITGTTGYGKTTELLNMMVQWAYSGYGFVYFDPKGRDSRELLRKLPEDRLNDVVWIEPGSSEHDKTVGLNFLEIPDCNTEEERENEIENRIENLKAIFDTDEYWGINMESITESMGRAMMQSDQPFSVIDMYFTLLHAERREEFALDVEDPYVREFCFEIARMDDETIRPLLKRIKSWVENSVIRRIISHRESTIDFRDIIDNDRIVIVRTPVENTDIKKMVTLGVMRNLWSAIQQRSYEHETDPDPYFVLCDEFDDIASKNLDIESMLARARSMRLSVTLASQYPSQFDEDTRKAMQNNCDNLIAFSVNDVDDAQLLMKRFRDYTAEDLISTDQYKAWTKLPLEGGRYSEPVLLRTFPAYPPLRSADTVDDIIERSLDQYGTDPLTDAEIMQNLIYSDANEAADPTQILDVTMAEAIRAVQIREGSREANDWVGVAPVDEELSTRLENNHPGIDYADDDLPEIRDASPLIDVELHDGDVVTRLSEAGEAEVQPDTGSVPSAGGSDHDAVLVETEQALTERGFSVDILEQDGSEQPDATATHPDHDTVFNIEAETTTPDRPAKVLQNLRRAHESERVPIFVVRAGDTDEADWASRVENILSVPLRELADGTEQFYNCDEVVSFGGGATAHGGVTGVRPASDTNRTVWTREDDERVLSDGETEFTRVSDEGPLSKHDVPAYYTHDRESGQYTVFEHGDTHSFDSRDAFKAAWTPIKQPFIPDISLPDPAYTHDSYVVMILPAEGPPMLFQNGETYPLGESSDDVDLWPGESTNRHHQTPPSIPAEESSGARSSTTQEVEVDPDSDGIEAFATMHIREAEGAQVPKETLFQAYSAWTDQHDIDGTNSVWFSRKLGNVVEYESGRVRENGDELVTVYTDIDLTPEGSQLLKQ